MFPYPFSYLIHVPAPLYWRPGNPRRGDSRFGTGSGILTVPCGGQLVAGLLNQLAESGQLEQYQLRLVFSGTSDELEHRHLEEKVPPDQLQHLTIEIHNPDDPHQLSYLAAAHDDTPIYVNRTLCDADMVLPIVGLGLSGQLGYAGIHGSLFRSFTDTRTRQRFLVPGNHGGRSGIR